MVTKYHFHNFWTIFCETDNGGAYIGESASFHIFLNMLAVEEFSPYAYALHIALSKVIVYISPALRYLSLLTLSGMTCENKKNAHL